MSVMHIDNYSHPFVATMTSDITRGNCGSKQAPTRMRRNMIMAQKTTQPLLIRPTKVHHMVPGKWLGNLHGEKRFRTLVRGYCGCSGEVKGRKRAVEGFFALATNVLKH